jgi:hypothetical protein
MDASRELNVINLVVSFLKNNFLIIRKSQNQYHAMIGLSFVFFAVSLDLN